MIRIPTATAASLKAMFGARVTVRFYLFLSSVHVAREALHAYVGYGKY